MAYIPGGVLGDAAIAKLIASMLNHYVGMPASAPVLA
jgi:hypothetical protein|tara:strand:- start:685 stop:795 length:111 start_codon:yes stop_codon:yes gene_type:complete